MSEKNDLSEREIEILKLVATGVSNKEIAQKLYISSNTVKVHLRNIFAKIGVESRTEAAMYAVNSGLIGDQASTVNGSRSASQNSPRAVGGEPIDLQQNLPQLVGEPPRKRRPVWLWAGGAVSVVVLLAALGFWVLGGASRGSQEVVISDDGTRWTTSAPMTSARAGLALAAFENQLYAFGGDSEPGVSAILERYDPATNEWQTLAEKPTPTSDIQAAVVGGKIYLPGGRLADNQASTVLEIYDPRQNLWMTGAALPEGRSAYGLAAFEGKLYLFGGWNGSDFVDTVYEYDPSLDRWTEKTPMDSRRGFLGVVEAGGKIYVAGGYDGKRALDTLSVYSPELDQAASNPWSEKNSLPEGRYKMGAAALADNIYLIGGTAGESLSQPMLVYNPQMDQWTVFEAPASESWSRMGVSPFGNYIYAVGGEITGSSTAQNKIYQAIYTILLPVVR